VPDAIFDEPRLARLYDTFEGSRDDLDHYEALIDELGATSVLDVGCGTGELAIRLARRGLRVTGVDPAGASLDVARGKPGAARVTWVLGDATTLPAIAVDLAIMTGNVAQVFVTDDAWAATLAGIATVLRTSSTSSTSAPGARRHLVFETRDPARRAWEGWTREHTLQAADTPAGHVETWTDVLDVSLPLVTFRSVVRFVDAGDELVSQ
jgi:SAM-dependent methyltransferase